MVTLVTFKSRTRIILKFNGDDYVCVDKKRHIILVHGAVAVNSQCVKHLA